MTSPVPKSPLGDADRSVTGKALNAALVDLVDLSLVGKQAHWNLMGRNFRSLHLQLDEVVLTARTFADEIAERAVAIGASPDARAATVASVSGLPAHPEGWMQDTAVVSYFIGALGAVISRLREHIATTETSDVVSQDLLIGVTAALEKHYWMFQAEQ
jgi:starvation-inducible DNA-binding protein